MTRSAGILPYRPGLELLIAHPGGPLWARRQEGAWSIIKGEVEAGEDPEVAARREFTEETGWEIPVGRWLDLGSTRLKSGKTIEAYAVEAPDLDPERLVPLIIDVTIRGRTLQVPEIDRVAWVGPLEARRLLNPAQAEFVGRLESLA